jgi:predicted nucleic acid-binding Zn ribbon protein
MSGEDQPTLRDLAAPRPPAYTLIWMVVVALLLVLLVLAVLRGWP